MTNETPIHKHANLYQRLIATNLDAQTRHVLEPGNTTLTSPIDNSPKITNFGNSSYPSLLSAVPPPTLKKETWASDGETSNSDFTQFGPMHTGRRGFSDSLKQVENTAGEVTLCSLGSPGESGHNNSLDAEMEAFSTDSRSPLSQSDKELKQLLKNLPENIGRDINSYIQRKLGGPGMQANQNHEHSKTVMKQKQGHKCPDCPKDFARKCELRYVSPKSNHFTQCPFPSCAYWC